eukprot:scaffold90265_cov60-Phaeocystis_antarctica.AAC.2
MSQPPTYSGLADSLPRRLQACMQELLSANERHHELLITSRGQDGLLQQAQAEVGRLTQLLVMADEAVELRLDESARERVASSDLREACALQQGRLEAMEAEVVRLQAALAASGHRGAAQSTEVAQLQQRCEEAERRAEGAEQRGFTEGMAQQHAQDQGRLRQMQARAKESAAQAFEEGRQQASSSQQAALLREQAQRRLLLHRAEEKRAQQQHLERKLATDPNPSPNPDPNPNPNPNPNPDPNLNQEARHGEAAAQRGAGAADAPRRAARLGAAAQGCTGRPAAGDKGGARAGPATLPGHGAGMP